MTAPQALPGLPPSDTCVKCGLCLPHCPTYRLTGDELYSPRGRLAAMSAVIHLDSPPDDTYEDALSTCLGCRACEAVCPGLVPYGLAFETAKADLATRRPALTRSLRSFVLGRVIASPVAMNVASTIAAAAQRVRAARVLPAFARRGLEGLRPLDWRRQTWRGRVAPPIGERRGTVALLSGCVMDPWFGPVHDATVGVLTHAGLEVVVPDAQTCCGALAAHDGARREARRLAARNEAAFGPYDLVISNSAGCTAHLKEYDHLVDQGSVHSKAADVTEFVAGLIEDGRLPVLTGGGESVAIQDPCHLRHAQRIVVPPRTIVRAAGCTPIEIDALGLCCGAAGIYSVQQPSTSAALGRQKAAQVAASGASIVAAANPGCEMQLRTYLDAVRVLHPIELYWAALSRHL